MATTAETQAPDEGRLEALAAAQGVAPVDDPQKLLGTFWPEDETADDFLAAVRAWRRGEAPSQA